MKGVVLIILDGWGYREEKEGNAIAEAHLKNINKYMARYPLALLDASGKAVGLPEGTPGFCENSYAILGTGKPVKWDHERLMKEARSGKLEKNKVIQEIFSANRIHLFAVLTENRIFGHIEMLNNFLEIARTKRKKNVFVHLILEGRESGLKSAYDLFLKWKTPEMIKCLSSIVGSMYALKRNNPNLVDEYLEELADPSEIYPSFISALMSGYDRDENDRTLKPRVLNPEGALMPGDTVVILGYRSSKLIPLVKALSDMELKVYLPLWFDNEKIKTIYRTKPIKDGFIHQLVSSKVRLLKVTETEKEKDLTYFFTGGYDVGDNVIFESPAVVDYSITPEMRAPEITGETLKRIKAKEHDFIVTAFSNPDTIAHTGNYNALVSAIEIVDDCVGRIVRAAQKEGMVPIIVGDHGNAEEMIRDNEVYLGHTTNPVPLVIASDKHVDKKLMGGSLVDVPPTIAKIMKKRVKVPGKPLI